MNWKQLPPPDHVVVDRMPAISDKGNGLECNVRVARYSSSVENGKEKAGSTVSLAKL